MRARSGRLIAAALVVVAAAFGARAIYEATTPPPGADACIRAVNDARSGATSGGRATAVAHACAPLFLEPRCRAAHEGFELPPPELRARLLADRCAQAYCDALEPKPKLCAGAAATPSELAAAWSEFVPAALKHDHGRRAADVIQALRAPLPSASSSNAP